MAKRYERDTAYTPPPMVQNQGAATQALVDTLTTFRKSVTDITVAIQSQRGAQAGAQKTEGTPKLKSNWTAYGRAYNNAALRNYVISQHGDMETQIAGLEADAKSVAEFQQLAGAVRKGALSSALPEARADIAEMYTRRITEGAVRIDGRVRAEQKNTNRAMLQQGLEQVSSSISRKYNSGDPTLIAEAQEDEVHIGLMIDGAVNSGDITPAEAVTLRDEGYKRVTRNIITGEFERQIRTGDPVGFIGKVMQQPVNNLSDEEKQQVVSGLFERLNRYQALVSESEALETSTRKQRWAAGERNATVRALRGQLSVGQIANMVENDQLSPADGRTLENMISSARGSQADDKELRFQVETNLLGFSESDIAGMHGLSYETRANLIEKRRQETGTWREDQGAQEALRRIDLRLGIPSGLGPQFQVSITPEQAKAAAAARANFYDLVEATPENERKAKYFQLADQAISHVDRDIATAQLEQARKALEKYKAQVGNPQKMGAAERELYDATVKRRQDQIDKLTRKAGAP